MPASRNGQNAWELILSGYKKRKNLLNNVSSGANPNAQKALVIITDGDPSDNDKENVLSRCDEQNIIRYSIGVGKVSLSTVTQLASEPKHNNAFHIQQYSGLLGLLDNLQKKINNIKGSKEAHGRNGFSVIHQEFAAVQFSSYLRTVFDFNDYQNGFAEEKLMKERHMKSLINTHRAINYVLKNLLNNVSSGANPNAQKALVIVTDGEPSDNDNENVLKRGDEQNIVRYIVGVGKVSLSTVIHLASEPKHNNAFHIQQYSGLLGLLDNLQKKINNIKGSKEAHGRNGFSVIHQEDSVIVGSVGSNDWRGSLYEVTGSGSKETQIIDPAVSRDSYMGYSSVLGMRHGVALLFSGAPRAERTGLVTLFTKKESTWTVTGHISGEQVGSYFGASLSLLDVDSDGDSDFLLVGAPLFYQSQPRADGRLYVYALSEQHFQKTLNVSESTTGRFAASVSSLKDLNGDSLSDVAVGATLENEGVVYLYLGDATCGINPEHAPESCGPYFSPECDGNSYLIGACYQFNSSLQAISNFTVAYQECTKREVNVVFLFDGSSSMRTHEFQMNKDFIKNVMKELSDSSIKFAAVQFSSDLRTVFDFNDYQNGFAEEKLMKERHMKSLTNTYRAINYVL
ncbi:integrin alpha-L-like protein [Labeo rohita]|uniref:Integrin alpha-L-like protein n=1 Tax=Labeo rohita TaxID=84645 RepID=A0A498M500_LABRO|nr:integrin alpha-L-like protein [Labeo rohita]